MALKLTLTSTSGGERQSRVLTKGSLSIGRGSGNDWVLLDPDQHLSRTHCMIAFGNGQYWLNDLSTNGMLVNGAQTPTSRDSRTVLMDGDTVVLGSWRLQVSEVDDRPAAADGFGSANFGNAQSGFGGRDPFASSGGNEGVSPLDVDPLADQVSDPLLDGPGGAAGRGFHHPMAYQPPQTRNADPFDVAGSGRNRDPAEDMFQGQAPVDAWKGPTQRDDAAAVSHAFSAPRPMQPTRVEEIDFDALLGDIMPQPAGHATPPPPPPLPVNDPFDSLLGDIAPAAPTPFLPAPVPATPVAPAPPPIARPAPQPELVAAHVLVPAPVPAAASPAAASSALFAAFLEGAGLSPGEMPPGDQEEAMRALGALFRAFVTGTRDVLMSRAEIKHEMRVEQTMIRARDNNALKFSISPEEALLALLRPNRPGYKQPLPAVEEAFDDIRSHELAVMAGMQTGLMALLKRFDPALLEARLQKGMLDGILPGARKARFWELFCTTYTDIAREAEDDFHALFGREFARAYAAQISKL